MQAKNIEGATRNLVKPADWEDEKLGPCGSLPIRDEDFRGANAMVSEWAPSPDELEVLNAGGSVILHVIGTVHPPVALGVKHAAG